MFKNNYPSADRMQYLDASGIRKVFDLAKELKDPVNLSIGLPHFDLPNELKDEAISAIKNGYNKYTLTQGIEDLRIGIGDNLKDRNIQNKKVLITSGVSGGIFLSFLSLFNPGDEVIIPDPYFVMYKHLLRLVGVKPVYVDTYPNFKMDPESVQSAITKKTKAIILNSPANPTGICLSKDEIKDLVSIAEKNNLLIISDEIYRHFSYDFSFTSPANYYEHTLILDGFSKSHAMTGWRLGYAAGPSDIIDSMTKLQQYSFVCAPSVAQQVGLAALQYDCKNEIDSYHKKRDLVYEGLKDYYKIIKPAGAFYFFIEAPLLDGEKFVKKAIKNNLLIIPGNIFSERGTHFRLSFAAEDTILEKGIEILRKIAKQ